MSHNILYFCLSVWSWCALCVCFEWQMYS